MSFKSTTGIARTINPPGFKMDLDTSRKLSMLWKCCADSNATIMSSLSFPNGSMAELALIKDMRSEEAGEGLGGGGGKITFF